MHRRRGCGHQHGSSSRAADGCLEMPGTKVIDFAAEASDIAGVDHGVAVIVVDDTFQCCGEAVMWSRRLILGPKSLTVASAGPFLQHAQTHPGQAQPFNNNDEDPHHNWSCTARPLILLTRLPDPSPGVKGEYEPHNISLRPCMRIHATLVLERDMG